MSSEAQRRANRNYYLKNREKILEKKKEYRTKDGHKERHREVAYNSYKRKAVYVKLFRVLPFHLTDLFD